MSAPATLRPPAFPAPPRLPLPLQLLYGVGEIPITVTMGLFGIYVLFFYNSVMGLDGQLAGIGVTAGLIVDAILDPYIGFRSDGSRWRLGRRQGFMLIGCMGMGPFFWALLSPPQGMSTRGLFLWLLLSSLGFRFCFATYRIPYLSLGAELTEDYAERTRVIALRSLLGLGGMAAAALLPLQLFFHRTSLGGDPKLRYGGYPRMGLAFGAVMTVGGLVAVFGTQSRRSRGDAFPHGRRARSEARHFFSGMWLFLRNRDFRAIWFAFTLCTLSVVVNFSLNLHYFKWYAGVEDHQWLSAIQTAFYAGAAAGVVAWIWLAKRGEKRLFFMGSIGGLIVILLASTLVVGAHHLLSVNHPLPLLIGNGVAGLFASALWVLPFSMMADVVDEDELASGLRREGVCFGVMNFGEKIASGGAILVSGVLLKRFIHLAPGEGAQLPEVTSRIGIAYGLVPAALLVCCIVMLSRYRLTRKRVLQIQAELATNRA